MHESCNKCSGLRLDDGLCVPDTSSCSINMDDSARKDKVLQIVSTYYTVVDS